MWDIGTRWSRKSSKCKRLGRYGHAHVHAVGIASQGGPGYAHLNNLIPAGARGSADGNHSTRRRCPRTGPTQQGTVLCKHMCSATIPGGTTKFALYSFAYGLEPHSDVCELEVHHMQRDVRNPVQYIGWRSHRSWLSALFLLPWAFLTPCNLPQKHPCPQ